MRITIISITLFLIMTKLLVGAESISRADFPEGFVFGTASSAHQFEGATDEGNKGDSIWDTFSRIPGRIVDFSNADKAVDQYHRFQNDINLMKDLGMDSYRFSISWPRIFPKKIMSIMPIHASKLLETELSTGLPSMSLITLHSMVMI